MAFRKIGDEIIHGTTRFQFFAGDPQKDDLGSFFWLFVLPSKAATKPNFDHKSDLDVAFLSQNGFRVEIEKTGCFYTGGGIKPLWFHNSADDVIAGVTHVTRVGEEWEIKLQKENNFTITFEGKTA